jgi:hypothetical protein
MIADNSAISTKEPCASILDMDNGLEEDHEISVDDEADTRSCVGAICYKCFHNPETRAIGFSLLQLLGYLGYLVAVGVGFFGIVFGNTLFAIFAFDLMDPVPTMVLLCLQLVAGWFTLARLQGPTDNHALHFLLCMFGITATLMGLVGLGFWTVMLTPMPAFDWMTTAPVIYIFRWVAFEGVPSLYRCAVERCSSAGTQEYGLAETKASSGETDWDDKDQDDDDAATVTTEIV